MTIHFLAAKTNILMSLKPTDRWYLIAAPDSGGTPQLFLNVNGVEAPLLSAPEFRRNHPGAKNRLILEIYNAMVKEVFHRLENGAEYIDLSQLEEELLAQFLEKGEEAG